MPSITQLQYLIAVERERHFAKAAEACHVSQPSLSVQLQKLEEELGVILFDRSQKPIIPTEHGMVVIEQAKKVLYEISLLEELAHAKGAGPRGSLSLGVIPTLSSSLIPLFLKTFAQTYPKIELVIHELTTQEMLVQLLQDKLDAGLLVTPLEDQRFIERHLFYEPFWIYAHENHEFLKKELVQVSDLNEEGLWVLSEGHCFRNQILKLCGQDRSQSLLHNVQFSSGHLETLKQLVKKNGGFTLIPELAVLEMPPLERKKFARPFKKPYPTREVSLVHSRSFLKETILNALSETILESLPTQIVSLKKTERRVIPIT
jgi:LysR family hydrogen peroxide-inducible transcriptional activator